MHSWAEVLPAEDRVFLYQAYHKEDALLVMGLNLIPLANIGNFVQGNYLGVIISIVPGLVGGIMFNYTLDAPITGDITTDYLVEGGLVALSYVIGLAQPFLFQRRWNTLLRDRLLLDEKTIREIDRDQRQAALIPPFFRIRPDQDNDLGVQLDLVRLSY
jgi:hypothetical protein